MEKGKKRQGMPTLIAKISTKSSLNGHFLLMERSSSNVIDEQGNCTTYTRNVDAGHSYILIITITGDNGSKYKINISGVTSAKYPTSEITLSDNRDDLPALLVG